MTGKNICEALREMRRVVAAANGIEYLTAQCDTKLPCSGFCSKCEAEARYLDSELNRLASEGVKLKIADNSFDGIILKLALIDDPEWEEKNGKYAIRIEDLDLSVRAFNCLKRAGFDTVGDLAKITERTLSGVRNLGTQATVEVITKLAGIGVALRPDDPVMTADEKGGEPSQPDEDEYRCIDYGNEDDAEYVPPEVRHT